MAELLVVRHGQASFGAADYDVLSDLGRRQAAALGALLRDVGCVPDRVVTGTLRRQKDTLAEMALGEAGGAEEHAGFDEYDFADLLHARFDGAVPGELTQDRRSHFRTLRDTIFAWQDEAFAGASETYAEFAARVEAARRFATREGARRVLVVSSGGPMGQLTATALGAPRRQMMELNLRTKNTGCTRFVFSGEAFSLDEFNATPHFMLPGGAELVSYS